MPQNQILTLQCGNFANFVGTHWWNLQEKTFKYDPQGPPSEIDHDVMYREGLSPTNRVTYTPRLLLIDQRGSMGAATQEGDLYHDLYQEQTTDDNLERIATGEPMEKIRYQVDLAGNKVEGDPTTYNMEEEVRVWSDFTYARFHPRSINLLNEVGGGEFYARGRDLFRGHFREELTDKIRAYIEECDYFEGFQVTLDSIDCFAGLGSSVVEYIGDEYRRTIMAMPLLPHVVKSDKSDTQMTNVALSYESLSEHSKLVVPMSVMSRNFDSRHYPLLGAFRPDLPYHSGAILATALDTFSLLYRLRDHRQVTLGDVCSDLSSCGRTICCASLNLLGGIEPSLLQFLDDYKGPLVDSLSPDCELSFDQAIHALSVRGVSDTSVKSLRHCQKERDMPAYRCDTVTEMVKYYMDCTTVNSSASVAACGEKLPTSLPYPQFHHSGGLNVIAGLHQGAFVGTSLQELNDAMARLKSTRGIERDDYSESLNRLMDLRDCYTDDHLL